MIALLILIFGLIIGSFVNAAVWRIHEEKPLGNERSECPHCGHKLQVRDLVPVLSWMALRRKCRYCGEKISIQYPLIELLTALLFTLSYLRWEFSEVGAVSFVFWLIILTMLVILLVYDYRWMLLPNRVMLPLLVVVLLYLALLASQDTSLLINHGLAAIIFGGSTYLLHQISKGKWIGGGDVKLLFIMGLLLGIQKALVAFLLAVYSGALISVALVLLTERTRKDLIPFGPFLIVGTVISLLFGDVIVNWYFNIILSV